MPKMNVTSVTTTDYKENQPSRAICAEEIKILLQLVAAFAVFFIKFVYDHFAKPIFILRLSLRSLFILGFLFDIFFQLTLFDVLIGQVFFSDLLPLDD